MPKMPKPPGIPNPDPAATMPKMTKGAKIPKPSMKMGIPRAPKTPAPGKKSRIGKPQFPG